MEDRIKQALDDMQRTPGTLSPSRFDSLSTNQVGSRSRVAQFRADSTTMLRQGPTNPFKLAIPAFESFDENGSADTQTLTLSHSIVDTPYAQSAVVWIDGSYYGLPDSIDYAAEEVDVTTQGNGGNIYVWYITDEPADIEVEKASPSGKTSSRQSLYTSSLALIHEVDQTDEPEYLTLDESRLQEWIPTDMALNVYVNAPYQVRWEDPNGDGAEPTNALLHLPVKRGQGSIEGFAGLVRSDMSE
jgi:hypothetical protein